MHNIIFTLIIILAEQEMDGENAHPVFRSLLRPSRKCLWISLYSTIIGLFSREVCLRKLYAFWARNQSQSGSLDNIVYLLPIIPFTRPFIDKILATDFQQPVGLALLGKQHSKEHLRPEYCFLFCYPSFQKLYLTHQKPQSISGSPRNQVYALQSPPSLGGQLCPYFSALETTYSVVVSQQQYYLQWPITLHKQGQIAVIFARMWITDRTGLAFRLMIVTVCRERLLNQISLCCDHQSLLSSQGRLNMEAILWMKITILANFRFFVPSPVLFLRPIEQRAYPVCLLQICSSLKQKLLPNKNDEQLLPMYIKLMFKVKFVIHDALSRDGSFPIRVVGNLPALGNWNPLNGLEMEEYYDGEWESVKQLEIPQGQEFQFKLVKLMGGSAVEWEQLPRNSNRKFKPQFHTKLVLRWSDHIGKALNEAKSSLKLQGLPGVMVNSRREGGMLRRNLQKRKSNLLSDSDSEEENQNDSFCVGRKKSSDIRESINSGDIEEIYYDTTELQRAYHSYKQTQVFLVSRRCNLKKEFFDKIEEELQQLHELENFKFKWLLLGDDEPNNVKLLKKISFKKIQSSQQNKIYLEEYVLKSVQKNHFIFLDLDTALNTVVGNTSACLYLPSQQFEKATKHLKELQKFQLICFDSGNANRELLKIFQEKRKEDFKMNMAETKIQELFQKNQSLKQKNLQSINLEMILEQLEFCQTETTVNTVHSFNKNQALQNILKPNSILLIQSQIMKTDKKFFQLLLGDKYEKRLIIIIHKGGMPQWIDKFSESKNICIILDNFNKVYLMGKLYDPAKKHRNAIQFIEMRARLFQKEFKGSWQINDNSFVYIFQKSSISKANNIKAQIQNVLLKDYSYFKFNMKQDKLKITWNLSHPVRLLRTLVRIKFMEEGPIGDFYIVSQNENYTELKQQVRLLINTNYLLMVQKKDTKIYDFGFGNNNYAKYIIKSSGNFNCQSTGSTSSTMSQSTKNVKLHELHEEEDRPRRMKFDLDFGDGDNSD